MTTKLETNCKCKFSGEKSQDSGRPMFLSIKALQALREVYQTESLHVLKIVNYKVNSSLHPLQILSSIIRQCETTESFNTVRGNLIDNVVNRLCKSNKSCHDEMIKLLCKRFKSLYEPIRGKLSNEMEISLLEKIHNSISGTQLYRESFQGDNSNSAQEFSKRIVF